MAESSQDAPLRYFKCDTPYCQKVITGNGFSQANVDRHIASCKANPPKPPPTNQHKRANNNKQQSIASFFTKTKKSKPNLDVTTTTFDHNGNNNNSSLDVDLSSTNDVEIDVMVEVVVEGMILTILDGEEEDQDQTDVNNLVDDENVESIEVECYQEADINSSMVNRFCLGYTPKMNDFFSQFPFQRLPTLDMVVVDSTIHHQQCFDNNFLLKEDSTGSVNQVCFSLQFGKSMKKIEELAELDATSSRLNHKYYNYQQIVSKVDSLNKSVSLLTITNYNQSKRIAKMNKTLQFHKRFLVFIATNNVSRLHELVGVALNNNHGIEYILEKCKLAVAGVYQARAGKDDKDMAFLVLKFGGPSLLDILHRAKLLPSTSVAYRINKECTPIKSSVHMTIKECFEANFHEDWMGNDAKSLSIKMDETYLNAKIRYEPLSNEPVGICYQHHKQIPRQFNSFADAKLLEEKLSDGSIHVPKECLVAGVNSLISNKPFNVLIAWPTCTKQDFVGSVRLYSDFSDSIKDKTGFPALTYCTDGDPLRRQVLNSLMKHVVSSTSQLGRIMRQLPLVDLLVGPNDETSNFDAKHIAKRLWTSIITTMKIANVEINKIDVRAIMELSTVDDARDILSIICPKDKQNVPAATSCLLRFVDVFSSSEKFDAIPYKLYPIRYHLCLVANIYEGVLALYAYVHLSLSEQIRMVSKASYSLFVLFRCDNTKFVPPQLYHDLQSTFIDTVCCVAKVQINCPEEKVYTIKDGTDTVEHHFGDCRLLYKHNQLDALEMVFCSNAISRCTDILTKHPEWVKKGRASRRLALDYSNIHDWTGDLVAGHVDIPKDWKIGLNEANRAALEIGDEIDVKSLDEDGVSLKRPNGVLVGVKSREIDWSLVDDPTDENEESNDDSAGDGDNDMPQLLELITPPACGNDNMVDVDGKMLYKASILKNLTEHNPLSRDRLRRVQGITRHVGGNDLDVNLDDILCVGDPVVMIARGTAQVANIIELSSGENKVQYIKNEEKDDTHITLTARILQLKTVDDEDQLHWNGLYIGDKIRLKGPNCLSIQPIISTNPAANMSPYYFNKQLLSIPLPQMRKHIGFHLVSDHVKEAREQICGFCGRSGCKSSLKERSHSGKKKFLAPVSDCDYFFPYKRVPEKPSKTHPCTNVITTCPVCNMFNWKYNLPAHYEILHGDEEAPEPYSDAEKGMLIKLASNK